MIRTAPGGETCLRFDPANRIADINASDFEFDMPLPPKPAGATDVNITKTKMKVPKGSVMPDPIFDTTHITDPTPSVHVTVPMTVPVKGKMPNIFAQSILATWKSDKTKLKKVEVKIHRPDDQQSGEGQHPGGSARLRRPNHRADDDGVHRRQRLRTRDVRRQRQGVPRQ